jgi:chromosome segregation ATPase
MSNYRNTTCMMSDLMAAESRMGSKIASAEEAARRVESGVSTIRKDMESTRRKVEEMVSDVGDLSGDLSDARRHIFEIDHQMEQLEVQRTADRRLIEQNRQALDNVQQDVALLAQDVQTNYAAIEQIRTYTEALQSEIDLAEARIAENDQHIQQLEAGVQNINQRLEAEHEARNRDRLSQMADVEAQQRLATTLRNSLDQSRVQRFGYSSPYLTAMTTLEHAEESTRLGRLEAARATYQEAQRGLSQVARDVDTREREYYRYRSRCEANLTQLSQAIQRAGTDDMRYWHEADYKVLQMRYDELLRRFQNAEFDQAGWPEQVIVSIEQMTDAVLTLQHEVGILERRLSETLEKAQLRIELMQKMLMAVMDVWGDNDFTITYGYVQEDDPKSVLKVQTVRPNRANVTLYMSLDGTVQFSWTGYAGMECATDATQFEEKMRSQHKIEVAVSQSEDRPGQRNPDFGPGGLGRMKPIKISPQNAGATKVVGR